MKAIICERPGKFVRAQLPEPEGPGPGEAIVRIRRVGICGTDYHAFAGRQPFFEYPRILGHELSGTIEAVGEEDGEAKDEKRLKPGDRVSVIPYLHCGRCLACRGGKTNCCVQLKVLGVHVDGGMRDRIKVPLTHLAAANDLTLDQAAVVEPMAIGAHAVRRADVRAGENVLVIGAGPIGLGVMAFAKRRGARVIAMDLSESRLAFSRTWAGADETVTAGEGALRRVAELTGGEFPPAVFDATGNARSMMQTLQYVANGGRLVFVGIVKDDITFSHPELHRKETTLVGSRNATRGDFEWVLEALRDGFIRAEGFITHRAPPEELERRWNEWTDPASGLIKAVVMWE
jgi:2-desacetyl-2-hydroxyethyl bacteriochlorophyllide A dehydrogenase